MTTRYLTCALVIIVLLAGCAGDATPATAPVAAAPTAAPVILPALLPTIAPTVPGTVASTADLTPSPAASSGPTTDAPQVGMQGTATAPADPAGLPGGSGADTDRVTPGAALTRTAPASVDQLTPTVQTSAVPGAGAVTRTPPPAEQYPLSIAFERRRSYPGSEITIEQTLEPGANHARYIVSYRSDGLKIYALMTVPGGPKPATGWPVVLFNHGYIPPAQYVTTERYVAYVDAFARAGYIVFKSDYRGHGKSEGKASGSGEGTPDYTTDVLNALTAVKNYQDADPNRIGSWGHSMGGQVTLRSMVVTKDIKAGVIWAGVVCSYGDMLTLWNHPPGAAKRGWRPELIALYGTPQQNPAFWAAISPNSYLADLSGPVQLHHGTGDEEVPLVLSERLNDEILAAGKEVEMFTYPGDNHNISVNFNQAMARSVAFMDRYVKGN